ncbi:MAG: sensor domain-containing diguanylate cyclase [candidate division WOR-3 bacterium]|nr:sensor domain-containing diguanylate cyclase [candidate division WOR-3 bacterium]
MEHYPLLEKLTAIASALLEHSSLEKTFDTITRTACSFFNASASAIMLFDKEKEYLTIAHSINLSSEYLKVVKVKKDEEIAGKVCQEKKPRFVPDVIKVFEEKGDFYSVEWIKKEGLKSFVTAPLLLKDEPIGCLNLYYRESIDSFEDFPALDFFCKLAALAIEHTKLINEIEEKSRIVTELEHIGIILSSTFETENILKVLLASAIKITNTDSASLLIVDEPNATILESYEFQKDSREIKKYKTTARLTNGISGEVLRKRKPVIISDLTKYNNVNPVALQKGRRAIVAMPLIAKENLIGILYVDSYTPRNFSPSEIEYLQLLCSQAAVAIDNTRLYTKIAREAQETAILYEVSRTFISTLDFNLLLQNILQRLVDTFGYLNLAVFLVDEETQTLKICSYINYPESVKDIVIKIGATGITGHVAATREMYYSPDVSKDPYYIPGVKEAKSEVCFPLMIGDRLIGVLDVESPEIDGFTPDDIKILSTLSAQIAIALDNARLYEEAKRLSLTDPLTGLPNRRSFEIMIDNEIRRAERYRRPFAVLMMDFDNFKNYNDKFGHSAGDNILKRFSTLMKEAIRDVDFLGRYGGDEFIAVLPETDANFALVVAERIRKKIESEKLDPPVTLSIGIAVFPKDSREKQRLIDLADHACYEAKEMGGNRVNFAGA